MVFTLNKNHDGAPCNGLQHKKHHIAPGLVVWYGGNICSRNAEFVSKGVSGFRKSFSGKHAQVIFPLFQLCIAGLRQQQQLIQRSAAPAARRNDAGRRETQGALDALEHRQLKEQRRRLPAC